MRVQPRSARVLPTAVRLYRTDGSFRSLMDFTAFGGLTLLFLYPPHLHAPTWLNPFTGPAAPLSQSPTAGTTLPRSLTQPPGSSFRPEDRPKSPPIHDVALQLRAFLHLSRDSLRGELTSAIAALEARRFDDANSILDTLPETDPNAVFLRGVVAIRRGDRAAATRFYEKAAALQHPQAMHYAATINTSAFESSAEKGRRIDLLSRAYEAGVDAAGYKLAIDYYVGKDPVYRDEEKALQIFRRLASFDHALSANWIGYMYDRAWGGLTKDDVKATEFYRRAAELGDVTAMRNLSGNLRYGRGTTKDPAQASMWLQKAMDAGDVAATRQLGVWILRGGDGVTADPVRGANLLRQAALKNDGLAQEQLGDVYREGLGVTQDLVQAYVYYGLARHNGAPRAGSKLAAVEPKMGSAENERARQLLAGTLPKPSLSP